MCINKKGTVACLGRRGCSTRHFRTCGTYIHTYIQTYTHIHIHIHKYTYIHTYIHTYTHTHTHTWETWSLQVHILVVVDVSTLSCPVVDDSDTETTPRSTFNAESTEICTPGGVTYRSLCHLIQTSGTSNVRVAYVGPCGTGDCGGGEVRVQHSLVPHYIRGGSREAWGRG